MSDFESYIQVADGNNEFEIACTYQDENVYDMIAYGRTDSSYILWEHEFVNNTATITVNDTTYLLIEVSDHLSLVSKNGNELPLNNENDLITMKNNDASNTDTHRVWLGGPYHGSTRAVKVGSKLFPKVNMKYYQYAASDCMTCIKTETYYYGAYSERTGTWYEPLEKEDGHQKMTISYYHSQRPDYTGIKACKKY